MNVILVVVITWVLVCFVFVVLGFWLGFALVLGCVGLGCFCFGLFGEFVLFLGFLGFGLVGCCVGFGVWWIWFGLVG